LALQNEKQYLFSIDTVRHPCRVICLLISRDILTCFANFGITVIPAQHKQRLSRD